MPGPLTSADGALTVLKINLVPVKEKKKRKEILVVLCVAAVLLLVSLGMFWFYFNKQMTVRNLDKEIASIDEESKAYEEKIKEIKDLKAKEDSLDALKATIKGISEVQRKVIVAVDQAALNLPEGVWLTRISQGAGADTNKFTLEGCSFTIAGLNNYLEALKKPGGKFKETTLEIRSITATVGNNKQVHQFVITTKVLDQGS